MVSVQVLSCPWAEDFFPAADERGTVRYFLMLKSKGLVTKLGTNQPWHAVLKRKMCMWLIYPPDKRQKEGES